MVNTEQTCGNSYDNVISLIFPKQKSQNKKIAFLLHEGIFLAVLLEMEMKVN